MNPVTAWQLVDPYGKQMRPSWSRSDIANAIYRGLLNQARLEDAEQAVYGFDCLDELGLHPLIHRSLEAAGMGVWPECPYPMDGSRTRKNPGQRCDVVLTPAPEALPLRDAEVSGTLFDDQPAINPEDAYWLEVKTVAQFETGGPFERYSAELLSPVAKDVQKIWRCPLIRHGGLLLLLFTSDQAVAEHDLAAWHRRCLDRGQPVYAPVVRGLRIANRIGNAWCSIAMFGVCENRLVAATD